MNPAMSTMFTLFFFLTLGTSCAEAVDRHPWLRHEHNQEQRHSTYPRKLLLTTDTFDGDALNNQWNIFDPLHGGNTISVSNGQLIMQIPGGQSHNMWSGSTNNRAIRIWQSHSDSDFEIEVVFDPSYLPNPSQTYQMEGLFIRGINDGQFLRFGSYSAGGSNHLFVSFINGNSNYNKLSTGIDVAPDRLKVKRTGNNYEYLTASPGQAYVSQIIFNEAMSVTGAGIYGGNHPEGSSPSFEVRVNAFNVLGTPSQPTNNPTTSAPTNPPTNPPTNDSTTTSSTSSSGQSTGDPPPLSNTKPFSDPFHHNTLDPRWQLFKQGNTAVGINTTTESLIYDIPSGTPHDMWACNNNDAPRLVQTIDVNAVPLGFEAKFDCIPSVHTQLQGLVAMETETKYLRFGFYHSNGVINLFYAFIDQGQGCDVYFNGNAADIPERLRLERDASGSWTASVAYVGSSSFVSVDIPRSPNFNAAYIGTYAGNFHDNPQFLSSIDYFMVDNDPLVNPITPSNAECTVAPEVDILQIWSGETVDYEYFGQEFMNIVGLAPAGTSSMSYAISSPDCGSSFSVTNPSCPLRQGSDGKRLYGSREFNIEVFANDLCIGENYVDIDVLGLYPQQKRVTINYSPQSPALPFYADWDTTVPIGVSGQLVDGHWGLNETVPGVRTLTVGYDKILTIGDRDWPANYEILYSFSRFTTGNSLGIGFGWRGHCCKCTTAPCACQATSEKLQWGWPLEGITWVRYGNSLEIWNYQQNKVTSRSVIGLLSGDNELVPGHFYKMRTQVQQVPQQFGSHQTNVKVRLWKDGTPEPQNEWHLTAQYDNDPVTAGKGSVFLLSYNTDAQFGPVQILPLPTASPTTSPTTANPTTAQPTTANPTTAQPTTANPTTAQPTTSQPTTSQPTTANPTTAQPTTGQPTTAQPTTANPTTAQPTTAQPTTANPTSSPTTANPTTAQPTTSQPTTSQPTTANPTTAQPTTAQPTTANPTSSPTTAQPTTGQPTTAQPTTANPTTAQPTTAQPTKGQPTTGQPTTGQPTTAQPTTANPTTAQPTTAQPTTGQPTTAQPTTGQPTTAQPTTANPTTAQPTTGQPTTSQPTTSQPTTAQPTTSQPTTSQPTTAQPTQPPTPVPTPPPVPPQTCTADGGSCVNDSDCCSNDCRGWYSSRTCRAECTRWWC